MQRHTKDVVPSPRIRVLLVEDGYLCYNREATHFCTNTPGMLFLVPRVLLLFVGDGYIQPKCSLDGTVKPRKEQFVVGGFTRY